MAPGALGAFALDQAFQPDDRFPSFFACRGERAGKVDAAGEEEGGGLPRLLDVPFLADAERFDLFEKCSHGFMPLAGMARLSPPGRGWGKNRRLALRGMNSFPSEFKWIGAS